MIKWNEEAKKLRKHNEKEKQTQKKKKKEKKRTRAKLSYRSSEGRSRSRRVRKREYYDEKTSRTIRNVNIHDVISIEKSEEIH